MIFLKELDVINMIFLAICGKPLIPSGPSLWRFFVLGKDFFIYLLRLLFEKVRTFVN